MLVFDEKKYAEQILSSKSYKTIKTQGRERCILSRYLIYLGYSDEEINKILSQIPMSGGEYLSVREKNIIFSKIIEKSKEYEFITGKNIVLYKEELDVIKSLENEYARDLLFVYLVYYKWASLISYLKFYSKNNDIIMVVENNNDLWKIAGLSKLRVSDRYRLCNLLYNKGLYKIDNFKSHNYFYLPFVKYNGEVQIEINNFDNILGELYIYLYPEQYKRCAVCGVVIKKTRSPKKYCAECEYKKKIRQTKENKKSLKSKSL